ncbi:MAG: putative Fe-S cluster assembly protein SufT [bacterium]|jgi:probable FeS assembly SUF system protein SufT|nr:putative Fe-S cluster assembly protein SufT [Verrucomicrobiota bacterium]
MNSQQEIVLKRDTDAIQIPSGNPLQLPAGTKVMVTQSLGGTYTVATPGGLARIDEKDADALGLEAFAAVSPVKTVVEGSLEEAVWNQLKTVFDPEIPVNVVDLGLIYECQLQHPEEGVTKAHVKMTLTAPGCGMGPTIAADARGKILTLEGINEAEVELVWDPAWNQSMISEAGRMKLGLV